MTTTLWGPPAPKLRCAGDLAHYRARVLEDDAMATRALLRTASGVNSLSVQTEPDSLEIRQVGPNRLTFTGYACVTDSPYNMQDFLGEYVEVVRSGAFTQTLKNNPDVIFCLNHDWNGVPMARTTGSATLRLSEDSRGLPVEASLDASRADVYAVRSAHDDGILGAMSFAFWVVRQQWSEDYDHRSIGEVDLNQGDVSIVTWPANPATTGTTALRMQARDHLAAFGVRQWAAETLAGATLSSATQNALKHVLDLVAAADDAVDKAQPLLAGVLGVPNPDADKESESITVVDPETRAGVSDAPWHPKEGDYSIEQWRRACLVHPDSSSDSKDDYKLPVREPDGTVNRNGCHAAAGRIHSLKGVSAAAKKSAAKSLVGLYKNTLHEDPPDALVELARASGITPAQVRATLAAA